MGTFLALSSIVGATESAVEQSLRKYTKSVGGGLKALDSQDEDIFDTCIIGVADGNTTIYYPDSFTEWDDCAQFLSGDLKTAVFSFHIHDGDLWMYMLYSNGEVADQFNPIPDYWDDDLPEAEINNWKGDPQIIATLVRGINATDIDRYLVRWNPREKKSSKAYPTDLSAREDWQLLDFMDKLDLPYPIDDDGNPKGRIFRIWTKEMASETERHEKAMKEARKIFKPWWKFW